MKVLSEVPGLPCKATWFMWNNKYILKLEWGLYEQTYKVNEWDTEGEAGIGAYITDDFIAKAMLRFEQMDADWAEALTH